MDARTKIGILLIVYSIQEIVSAPSSSWQPPADQATSRVRRFEDKETGRIFWTAMGDILESLPFLPLTINVPDVVSSVWGFFTGFFPGATSGNKKPKGNTTALADTGVTRDDLLLDYLLS